MKLKVNFCEIESLLNVTILLSFSNYPEKNGASIKLPKNWEFLTSYNNYRMQNRVTCKTAMVLPLSKLFLWRCSHIRVCTYYSEMSVPILRKKMVTCSSQACFTDHGTAIPEFVAQMFNIWLDILFIL